MRAEAAAALAVAVLLVAGCSTGDEPSAGPTPAATPSPSPTRAAFGCDRVSGAEVGQWLGAPLEVEANPTEDGATACSAVHLGDERVTLSWAPVTGAGTLDVASNRVFGDREPAPAVEETTLPGGTPARMVVTEVPGTQIQVDLVSLTGDDGLHVVVSAGAVGGGLTLGLARLVDTAARIAEAYATPAG